MRSPNCFLKDAFLLILLVIGITLIGNAQPETASSELYGEDFRSWLKQNWFDDFESISRNASSGYRGARLEMYNNLDQKEGNLICLYSGLAQEVPTSGYSSAGSALPFNCEHIIPQSTFDSRAPMKNDIHHLAPTFDRWNSSRGSFPFDEIEDSETEKWMYLGDAIECDNTAPCLPTNNIDLYSEMISSSSSSFFEPREDAKGNIARAVFYFYTMYPQYSISKVGDVNTFYQWHLDDPVNEADIKRNEEVASFQGNQNPYVAKPDWVYKAFIADQPVGIEDASISEPSINSLLYYNSFGQPMLYLNNSKNVDLAVSIFNIYGKLVATFEADTKQTNYNLFGINDLNKTGIYFLSVSHSANNFPVKQHVFFYNGF